MEVVNSWKGKWYTNEKHKHFQAAANANDRDCVCVGGVSDRDCRCNFCEII